MPWPGVGCEPGAAQPSLQLACGRPDQQLAHRPCSTLLEGMTTITKPPPELFCLHARYDYHHWTSTKPPFQLLPFCCCTLLHLSSLSMMFGTQVFLSLDELQCPHSVWTASNAASPKAQSQQLFSVQVAFGSCALALVNMACL